MDVRTASVGDAPILARLGAIVQALHFEHRPDWFKPADAEGSVGLFEQLLDDPTVTAYIAQDDTGEPLGYVLVRVVERPETVLTWGAKVIEIDQVGVAPSARRSGVAGALFRAVRQLAREVGADRLHLTVWKFNEDAQAFFTSQDLKQTMLRMTDP